MTSSVIISTYNGEKKIGNLLNALLQQTDQSSEVLVVIDGSTDDTLHVVKSFESEFSGKLRIVVQENRGRAGVRNRGANEAKGEVLIFFDDDMTPWRDSIERHKSFHKNHHAILSGNSVETIEPTKTDIQNYKGHLTERWTEKYQEGTTQLNESNFFFTAANCSMKKEDFKSLGGFDERLTDAEDHDFGYRAFRAGIPVVFDKSNRAFHYDPVTCISYIKRLRAYAKAHATLQTLYPDRYKKARTSSSIVKHALYRLFALPFWPRLIDSGTFGLLPQKLRYKLYDIVIQAFAVEYPHIHV
jgi:glycosyltransferase involved in cell wall biosynthesis